MFHPTDVAEVSIARLRTDADLTITITTEPAAADPDLDQRIEHTWSILRRDNPRLHDGPVLSVLSIDFPSSTITCRIESYRRLAVQTAEPAARNVPTGVQQLSVTGAIVARDAAGKPHILMGRRGAQTRMYHGLWELAPAGGLDPQPGKSRLGRADVLAALQREAHEELGLDLPSDSARIVAICRDEHAASDDLVVAVELPGRIDPRRPPACAAGHWEYLDTAWLALADARDFAHSRADAIIPPARALLLDTGWIRAKAQSANRKSQS